MSDQIADSTKVRNARARDAALLAAQSVVLEPTDLVEFQSRGRVIVIGNVEAQEFAPRLTTPLQPQVLLIEGEELPGVPVISQGGRSLLISGHLGAFTVQLGEPGKPNAETLSADLILDLGVTPQLSMPMKPPGYLVAATDETSLASAAEQLADLVGVFDKPRYFNYDASICAHKRSGYTACTRCIDACPADAISSLLEKVSVDSNLCQGGGVCATVCPSGAMRYSYPQAKDTLEQVRLMLNQYHQAGGVDPIVVFTTEQAGVITPLAENLLPVQIEELGSVGLEVWLSALAYGASHVLLLDDDVVPTRVLDALRQQLVTSQELLTAMGYPESAVKLVNRHLLSDTPEQLMPAIDFAKYSGLGGKRPTVYMAIDHLFEQAARAKPMATLTVGAPFGTAQVDAKACTLCLSCVGACPGKALMAGQDVPQLRFIEANCLQCGMCTRTCPEDAIWITPRLLFDRESRAKVRLLHEEPPFCCTECGKPFATRSVIESMLKKLEGHWMFKDGRSKNRLTMCQDCRVVDIAQDPEAMSQGMMGETLQ
ncbi:MAG: 4Fe-4S binding protein [Sedimenticola sp.]|nr:4Fe-4S binding protein [Sedimenticola sp.]